MLTILLAAAIVSGEPEKLASPTDAVGIVRRQRLQEVRETQAALAEAEARLKSARAKRTGNVTDKKRQVAEASRNVAAIIQTVNKMIKTHGWPTKIYPHYVTSISLGEFDDRFKIVQILGAGAMLVRDDGIRSEPFILSRYSTEGLADGQTIQPEGTWVCVGRHTYTTAIGASKTVFVLSRVPDALIAELTIAAEKSTKPPPRR
jgi:hypothetical protein